MQESTLAFLFTDVEGSTARWEADAVEARAAIERQENLIRQAVEARRGTIFKLVGDQVCAVFRSPDDALRAALDAQIALSAVDWGAHPVRVRMALHVGAATATGDDFVGPSLNRVARVLEAAQGGQVLVSGSTASLFGERLPESVALLDLGEYELAGLKGPQRLFQLLHPSLPREFPAPRVARAQRHNLPSPPGPLVGRDRELRRVTDLLRRPEVRLLTLTGTGGSGKTRLAIAAATELVPDFPDGVFLVELAALSEPGRVVPAIAHALGIGDRGAHTAAEELREHLRRRKSLLVLDNFEQVLEAAPEVGQILAACPEVQVLATSRAPLRLSFEHELPVEPLGVPDPDHVGDVEELVRVPAVDLFLQRAKAVRPSFDLTNQNARDVAALVARLDGLPLAIELAAARLRFLPVRELLVRLGSGLDALGGGPRDRPSRHRTLRNTIAWSYDLLDPPAQRLLDRLSVFAGGFTSDAAAAIGRHRTPEEDDVLGRLAELVEMNLIRRTREDADRLDMLDTIRDFARERLKASGEDPRPLHARWFLDLAERAEQELRGADQAAWLGRLDDDHENFRAATRWALEAGQVETALGIATALWRYWELRGYLTEGRRWLEAALAPPGRGLDPALRVRALCSLAALAKRQGDLARAEALLEQSAALADSGGDAWGLAATRNLQGMVAYERLDLDRALARYEESEAVFRRLGDRRAEAYVLGNTGLALAARDPARAAAALGDAVALFRSLGDARGLAGALNNLGDALERSGDLDQARAAHEESLALKREIGGRHGIADSLTNLASLELEAGRAERAEALYHEALALYREMAAPRGTIACLRGLAGIAAKRGDFPGAARLLGSAERHGEDVDVVLPVSRQLRRIQGEVEEALGKTIYDAELARGRQLGVEKILEDHGFAR